LDSNSGIGRQKNSFIENSIEAGILLCGNGTGKSGKYCVQPSQLASQLSQLSILGYLVSERSLGLDIFQVAPSQSERQSAALWQYRSIVLNGPQLV
jgi:hypothetical protein